LAVGEDAVNANEKFAAINQAYEVLGDEIKRKRYEFVLANGETTYDDARDWTLIDYKVGNPLKPSAEARAAQDAQREEFEAELKRRIATRDKIDDISLYLIAVVLITAVLMFAGSFLYKRWSSQQVQSILVDFCCHFNVHVNFDFIAA
jgi:hypothetical protein